MNLANGSFYHRRFLVFENEIGMAIIEPMIRLWHPWYRRSL